jgi:hypothetical protein
MQFVGSTSLGSSEAAEDLTIIATTSVGFGTDARVSICQFLLPKHRLKQKKNAFELCNYSR